MNKRLFTIGALIVLSVATMLPTMPTGAQTAKCEAGLRLFDHELLATDPVCIPENPQRIVAFDMAAMELLLFTDKQIVGAYDSFKDEERVILPTFEAQFAKIPDTGLPPNLELITESKPDLIVTLGSDAEYQALSPIAPTVVIGGDTFTNDWKLSTEFWSEVFNVPAVYQQMLDTYNARVAELQQALGEHRDQIKVSLMTANPGWLSVWLRDSAQGKILQDVGVGRPDSQNYRADEAQQLFGSAGYETLSEETLNLADGDALFIFAYASSDAETAASIQQGLADIQKNPLWQSLKVVHDGHAYVVGPHWYRGLTYLQANLILDDLFNYLAHTEPKIPNPIRELEAALADKE